MLFVRLNGMLSKAAAGPGPAALELPVPLLLRPGENIAGFSGDDLVLARVLDVAGKTVRADTLESRSGAAGIRDSLFRRKPFFFHPEIFYRGLISLSDAIGRGPVFLHWKEREGQYLRCLATDAGRKTFREKYLDWEDWNPLRGELERLRRETNSCLRAADAEGTVRARSARSNILRGMMDQMGLGDVIEAGGSAVGLLTVFLETDVPVPPFEDLSDNLIVTYRIPCDIRTEEPAGGKDGRVTLLYSGSRPGSRPEVMTLCDDLKSSCAVDVYGDDRFEDYQTRLADSAVIHFSGHGTVSGTQGSVHLDGKPLKAWNGYGTKPAFAYLNCCETGAVTGGIVGSIVAGTGASVIASPYEIPDNLAESVRDYYRFLDIRDPETAFRILSVKDPSFGRQYRFFAPNRTKFD